MRLLKERNSSLHPQEGSRREAIVNTIEATGTDGISWARLLATFNVKTDDKDPPKTLPNILANQLKELAQANVITRLHKHTGPGKPNWYWATVHVKGVSLEEREAIARSGLEAERSVASANDENLFK